MIPLDAAAMRAYGLPDEIGLHIVKSLASTQTYVKEQNIATPFVCLAEEQTRGRGRMNRSWHSPFGENLYFSYRHSFQKPVNELSGLSMVVSLAIAETLARYPLTQAVHVKWPNDVLVQGKKIAGILIDTSITQPSACDAIIGIGLNVNMQAMSLHHGQEDPSAWTSLCNELGYSVNRNQLFAWLMQDLLNAIDQFILEGLAPFLLPWHHKDYLKNQIITLYTAENSFIGRMLGITDEGFLRLQTPDGHIRVFSGGQASLHKKGSFC